MKESTIRLLVVASITILGMVGTMLVLLIGMIQHLVIVDIIAIAAVPNAVPIAGVAFLMGHSNGVKANGGL